MTIRDWAVDYCCTKGMPKRDAEAVIDAAERAVEGDWNVSFGAFSDGTIGMLMEVINDAAVQRIAANRPDAAYRPDFVSTKR